MEEAAAAAVVSNQNKSYLYTNHKQHNEFPMLEFKMHLKNMYMCLYTESIKTAYIMHLYL